MYPRSIQNLINSFKLLPGIGEKTAERLAFSVLNLEKENVDFFSQAMVNAKQNIKRCSICNHFTDNDICSICSNDLRNKKELCIVEDSKSVFVFEKSGVYNGKYFVLNGLISPIDGINPENIGLDKLLSVIKGSEISEIIIAVKPSVEGETTALYIKKILEDYNLTISRIATGIPIGADVDYIDSLTLERALIDRVKLS